jgi:LysM repeat protein
MSNKAPEKLDGVFDSSGEKISVKSEKPARPPRSKAALSRETKVGLAVIGALLVIFAVVLFVRFRGGPGEDVAQLPASSKGAEQPKKQQPKTTPPESRTLIASQSGATGQWPALPGAKVGDRGSGGTGAGGVRGGTLSGGSAYGSAYSANDQPVSPATSRGYLPAEMGRGSRIGMKADDVQAGGGANEDADSAIRSNRPSMQKQTTAAINPFSREPTTGVEPADASANDEALASDETDTNDAAAVPAGLAAVDPFSKRPGGQFQREPREPSISGNIRHPQELQSQNASAADGDGGAFNQKAVSSTEIHEAEKLVPQGLHLTTGADRRNGNDKPSKHDDRVDLAVDADSSDDTSKLPSVKGIDLSVRQPSLADAEGELPSDSTLPFRRPVQPADAPARLDEALLEGNGLATSPIQRDEAADLGQTYAVAADDTYWTIAKKTYGSGSYFKALYEHNRRRLNNAGSLRPGMQLILPDEATLQRLYPTLCPRPQRVAAAPRTRRASATLPEGNTRQYVVSEGDTLYDVARRQLGKASRWAEIYELNRDAIGNASDRLAPGTQLNLPE